MKSPIKPEPMLDRGGQPSVRELLSTLVFNPAKGTYHLGEARIVMQRARVGETMRAELTERLGAKETTVFMLRQGYLSGRADARFVRETWPNLNAGDAFTAGTRLHMFSGVVRVETVHNDFDFTRNRFSGDFIWHDSVEAEQVSRDGLRRQEPVCWTQVGYAAGYASEFFGTPIVYKETACIARGDQYCRVIGKPLEEWDSDDPVVRLFRTRVFDGTKRPRTTTPTPTAPADPLIAPVAERLDRLARTGVPVLLCGLPGVARRAALARLAAAEGVEPGRFDRRSAGAIGASELHAALEAATGTAGRGRPALRLVLEDVDLLAPALQLGLARGIEAGARVVATTRFGREALARQEALDDAAWYALAPGIVELPPLEGRGAAERRALAERVHGELIERFGGDDRLSTEALDWMAAHPWTELAEIEVVLTRALIDCAGRSPEPKDILAAMEAVARPTSGAADANGMKKWADAVLAGGSIPIRVLEHEIYRAAVRRNNGNLSAAARQLDLTRAQLAYRLKRMDADSGVDP